MNKFIELTMFDGKRKLLVCVDKIIAVMEHPDGMVRVEVEGFGVDFACEETYSQVIDKIRRSAISQFAEQPR